MIKKYVIIITVSMVILSCASNKETILNAKANIIHDKILTIDTHTDTPMRFSNTDFDISKRNDSILTHSKVDFPRMIEGGLDAAFFAVFIGQGARNDEANSIAIDKTNSIINSIHTKISENSDVAQIALSPTDAYQLEKEGKRAIYIGIENGYALGSDITNIKKYHEQGVRYITLCHTSNNDICDSSNDVPEHDGLSAFGKDVVAKMNAIGMIVDISHVSDKSFYDVLDLSTAPVIASHSCAKAICDNPRNISDDMLKKLSENGGVIQLCILSDYVKKVEQDPLRIEAEKLLNEKYQNYKDLSDNELLKAYEDWEKLDDKYTRKLATVADAVDHIDHIVEIAGIDHIGIGTDFDGGGVLEDCIDVSQIRNITIELVKRGYSEQDIEKIWSGNLMRVFEKVVKLAAN